MSRRSVFPASVRDLSEHHELAYTAAYITCPLEFKPLKSTNLRLQFANLSKHARITQIVKSRSQRRGIVVAKLFVPNTVALVQMNNLTATPLAELRVDPVTLCPPKGIVVERDTIETQRRSPGLSHRSMGGVEFTVCGPILHSNYSNLPQLVEKIEVSRLLGAGRVVLYSYSISASVDAVLRMYARDWEEGRDTLQVVVLPWELPAVFK